ncbi:hypothetical protein F5Y13DRAFT_204182 [Hypoxylon sp. FL1857]|nr:hypothetical protein F5Y13DRAFT_204182 [Hypoxylon sp. FL1857]
MSYQYLPPQEDPELGVSQVGYIGGSHLTATASTPEDSQIPPARRRESLSQEFKLKRSVSTPNVRPQGPNEADPGPPGLPNEKRRNKLGYHRTPVACATRNKSIRWNQPCITLHVSGDADGTYGGNTIESTLPSASHDAIDGKLNVGVSEPPLLAPVIMKHLLRGQKVSPNTTSGRAFSYGPGTSEWMSTEAAASAAKMPGDANASWASYPHGMPETPDLSSYASNAPPVSLSTWPATSLGLSRIDTNSRLDDAWKPYPPGTRSMSYSDDPSGQFSSASTRPYERVQVAEAHLSAQGSLSAGAVPHPTYNVWQQSYQYAKPNDDYEGWYEDHEHHAPTVHLSAGEDPSQAGDKETTPAAVRVASAAHDCIYLRLERAWSSRTKKYLLPSACMSWDRAERLICLSARSDLRHVRKLENAWGIDKNDTMRDRDASEIIL